MNFSAASTRPSPHHCRLCGATSYRPVIARDERGAMRPTAMYQCSGCSVVFADRRAWWAADDVSPAALRHERTAASRLVCEGGTSLKGGRPLQTPAG